MKKKKWIIFGGLTVFVVGYALFDFQNEKRKEEIKSEKSKVIAFHPEQINEISILSKDVTKTTKEGGEVLSNKIKLVRTSEGWKIEEPIQEVADQSAIDEFIEGLTTEKAEDLNSQSTQIDWKVFGLDDPRGEIDIQNNLGEKTAILVASKKNYQGDSFLRRNQEAKVLLASSTWFSKIEKKPFDFRDHRLFKKSLALVTEINVQTAAENFLLHFDKDKWSSPSHEEWKLDQQKVRDFLEVLSGSVVEGFEKESAPTLDEMKKWGLRSPRAVIRFKLKEGAVWEATLGRDHDLRNLVLISEPLSLVKISAVNAEKLADVSLDILRDRHELVAFRGDEVKMIELRSSKGQTEIQLKGKSWEPVKKANANLKIDSNQVGAFVVRLEGLQVGEFLDKKVAGSEKFSTSLVLKDESGKKLLDLKFSEPRKMKVRGRDRSSVIVQTGLTPESFSIDEGNYKSLGIEKFLSPESEKNK